MARWIVRPDFPGGTSGPWNRQKVAEWRASRGSETGDRGHEIDGQNFTAAQLNTLVRYEQWRAAKRENDEETGLLVRRDEVEQEIGEMILRIKERLESIPDELLMELPAKSRHQLAGRLQNKLRLILSEMAAWEES